MNQYHKIQTLFKRDPDNHNITLLMGEYSLPEFDYLKSCNWVFTEKVDGTNTRVVLKNGELNFLGKAENSHMPPFLLSVLENMFTLEKIQTMVGSDDICLYGEGYGYKINKGGKYSTSHSFVLFDVRIGNWWLERTNVQDIAGKLGIDVVPVIGTGKLCDMVFLVEKGFPSRWGDFVAEGIVARPGVELQTRGGDRIITKLKYKDFAREK